MPNPTENKPATSETLTECADCKALRNGVLFTVAAAAAGTAIYLAVKRMRRKKMEKELLAYEIWG